MKKNAIFIFLFFISFPLFAQEKNNFNCENYKIIGDEFLKSSQQMPPKKVYHDDKMAPFNEKECKETHHSIYYCFDNQSSISRFTFSVNSITYVENLKINITSSQSKDFFEWKSSKYYDDFINNIPSLSFSLPKGKSLVKIDSDTLTFTPSLTLSSEKNIIDYLSLNAAAGFCYIGVLLLLLLYNIVLFFKTHLKSFLYLSIYTISVLIVTAGLSGWISAIFSALGITLSAKGLAILVPLASYFSIFSLMLFLEFYLDMDKHSYYKNVRYLNLAIKSIFVLAPITFALLFMGVVSIAFVDEVCLVICSVALSLFMMLNIYVGIKNKNKFIYNICWSILILVVFCAIAAFLLYQLGDASFAKNHAINLGVFIQRLMLSIAIGEKLKQHNEMFKEKILSLNHELLSANQTLEARIEEKTRYHTIVLSSIDEGIFCYSLSSFGELEVISDTVSQYLKEQIGIGSEKILLSDMLESLHFSKEEIQNISLKSREVFYEKNPSFLVSEIFPHEISVIHNKESKYFEVLSTPIMELDKVTKVMVCLRDITRAKRQRNFLKDILEYSAKIQKMDTIDEVISSVAAHLHEIFPVHKISMLLIQHRNTNVVNAENHGFSEAEQKRIKKFHMDESLIRFLQENDSLFSFSTSIDDAEGKKTFLKFFMQGREIDENKKYILSIFLEQVIEIIKIKMQSIALEKYVNADALTGTFNRGYLDKMLKFYQSKATKPEHPYTVIYCDVNGLKRINDNYSHGAGDTLIKEAANIIKNSTRDTDLVFRCGGDEFVIICPNILKDGGEAIRQRIISNCQESSYNFLIDGKVITEKVGLSIGIADSLDGDDLLNVADKRMILDKENFYKTHTKYR